LKVQIELTPTLERCIETTARRELAKYAGTYLELGREDSDLEAKIELLRGFLKSVDIGGLRAQSEKYLVKGETVRFLIYMTEGRPDCEMKVDRYIAVSPTIYGPVQSWRLGKSLGIDLLPADCKTCSFDCIYCQLGTTGNPMIERREFITHAEMVEGLEKARGIPAEYATFAGMGEPTLAVNLGESIKTAKEILKLPVAVITNSSLIPEEGVRRDLALADVVLAKIDAADEATFRTINRPFGKYILAEILQGIKQFRAEYNGKLALQIMFTEANKTDAAGLADIIRDISPDEVQINTPLRPCPVKPLSPGEIAEIGDKFSGISGLITVYDAQ